MAAAWAADGTAVATVAATATAAPIMSAPTSCGTAYDCFLTHDWGKHQANHKRVGIINEALQARGWKTWFDEEMMTGNIERKMMEGIDGSRTIICFVTDRYCEKANGDGERGDGERGESEPKDPENEDEAQVAGHGPANVVVVGDAQECDAVVGENYTCSADGVATTTNSLEMCAKQPGMPGREIGLT